LASERPSSVGCDALSGYQVRQVAALLRSVEEIPVPRSALQRLNFAHDSKMCLLGLMALLFDENFSCAHLTIILSSSSSYFCKIFPAPI
jgi:hypothetical protein